jgi:hypothetical protein
MRRKSHVRFGERDGENRIERSMYGVSVSTLRVIEPSPDDVAVTQALVQAGKLMDLGVLDHLIITSSKYVSLKERGLGFNTP